MAEEIKQIKIGTTTYDIGVNSHTHAAGDITSGTIAAARLPAASGSAAGITIVYPAASCTTFSSDSGTVTPLAVQKGAKMFAITRPTSSTVNAITRYSNTTGDVQDSKIIIEDVTNSKDSSKKAQVISIPAEGGKKMVYGYCTDQVDGTSFIGGVFDQSATSYPYNAGLAIGGTSGNLLWKGARVLTTDDSYTLPTASSTVLGGVKIGTGIGISNGVISNSGVRSVATGTTNGTISVNTNGTTENIAVKGLGSNANTSTAYLPTSGGTMKGTLVIDNGAGYDYSFIRFNAASGDTIDAELRYNSPRFSDDILVSRSQFAFYQYSYSSSSTPSALTRTNYYEAYQLPATAADLTSSKSYYILTSKTAVTVAQGGTGATTAAKALVNLGADKAIKSITRSGTTFTYTCLDGTTGTFTQQDNNTTYSAATTSAAGLMSAADKTKLDGIAEQANKYSLPTATSSTLGGVKIGSNITVSSGTISLTKSNVTTALGYTPPTTDTVYTHPTYTSKSSGLYKITVDSTGHISAATAVAKSDITALGIPAQDTTYTLPTASSSTLGGVKIGTGIAISSGVISNSGVRSIATGSTNGTISVNTNGTSAEVAVKGLGSNAYTSTAYLPLSGGTMTGTLTLQTTTTIANNYPAQLLFKTIQSDNSITTNTGFIKFYDDHDTAANGGTMVIQSAGNMVIGSGESPAACYSTDLVGNTGENTYITSDGSIYFYTNCQTYSSKKSTVYINTSGVLYGACWNDYAEYRAQIEEVKPGYIVYSEDDGKLRITKKRLQKFEGVVSDTFGFSIGETDDCKTPLAVSGRVLVYTNPEDEFHSGDCVCAGPNGLACRMTREEIINYPDRIVGIVSEIPTYEVWGTGNVKVNGRIWIKVR